MQKVSSIIEKNSLTARQEMFKEAFYDPNSQTCGNGYKSAIVAHYGQSMANQACKHLVGNSRIIEAGEKYLAKIKKETVATRQQRQLFWTKVYFDKSNTMGDRLRASELLGKSEADFTEGIIDRTESVIEPLTEQETADLKRLAALSTIKMIESEVIDG